MNDLKRIPPRVDAGPRTEAIKNYIANNRATCKHCKAPIFWCETSTGKRIPMDFPSYTTPHKKTHVLIPTAKDGVYLENELLALPSDKGTHSTHLETCKGRKA